jgi:hypothetical protein
MKHSLAATGLSLSQAQSISNLCNQRVREIDNKLSVVNNASKSVTIDGVEYQETQPNPMPDDVVDMLTEKARLSATQAFLMENMRAKEALLNSTRKLRFDSDTMMPKYPSRGEMELSKLIDEVDESWGWDQLTTAEYNEYLEVEAYAAHIGQFIHNRGKLDQLRKELPNMKTLEWLEVETGKKTPVKVITHHTADDLLDLHEELASLHRGYEQRVNYFKAKVKNLVTNENARIARANADEQARVNNINQKIRAEHESEVKVWLDAEQQAQFEFQEKIETQIKEIAAYRIQVPNRFQPVIDMFVFSEQ